MFDKRQVRVRKTVAYALMENYAQKGYNRQSVFILVFTFSSKLHKIQYFFCDLTFIKRLMARCQYNR